MRHIKFLVACPMIGILLFCSSSVSAITRVDSKRQPSQNHGRSIESVNSIKRATELVQKMQKGVLYTDKNQYDLTGVKIIDHAEGNKVKEPTGGRKRVVEIIFVNNALKEVILHK